MLDLGTSFLASVARDPNALAVIDGDVRLTYAQWYRHVSALVAGLDGMGLKPGDHLLTLLQNRYEAATLHWACQLAGIVITPINWRAKPDEIDFCAENSAAKAVVYEAICAEAVAASNEAQARPRDRARGAMQGRDQLCRARRAACARCAAARRRRGLVADALHLGHDRAAKGVPRRQRAERAAAVAHVAQNLYAHRRAHARRHAAIPHHGCALAARHVPRSAAPSCACRASTSARRCELIEAERVTNLYLVPTLYHDLVHHPRFARRPTSRSVRKLGFAGAPMTDAPPREALTRAFQPDLFVNHYGSSEIYTFTDQPERAGEARLRRPRRHQSDACGWCKLDGDEYPDDLAAAGEEGEIIARPRRRRSLRGLLAAARGGRQGAPRRLVLHRRHRLCRRGRRPLRHRPGRRHDHHRRRERLPGRDRELPVAASRRVRGGRGRATDERWGKIVAAFIKRSGPVEPKELDALAAPPDSPTTSGRGATYSSRRYRSRRSASPAPQAGGRRV